MDLFVHGSNVIVMTDEPQWLRFIMDIFLSILQSSNPLKHFAVTHGIRAVHFTIYEYLWISDAEIFFPVKKQIKERSSQSDQLFDTFLTDNANKALQQ